jgi:branched-chain amino acid aminotransferase
MSEKVFLNDKLLNVERACISVKDSGFLYGAGLFETMRSCNSVVFALNDHLDRLLFSAQALSISHGYDKKYIIDAVYQTLRANKLQDARLRLTLTSGPVGQGPSQPKATLLITAVKFEPYPAHYYHQGATVVLSAFKQNPGDPTYGHKTVSYLARMLALQLAHRRGAAEALWFTVDNRLAEGCISNVFLVKDSKLLTPPVATPVLAGVARKTICQIAVQQAVRLIEKNLFISDVLEADEIFLTNVIMQVLPVTAVEAHRIGAGQVGPVTKKLAGCFEELLQKECAGQRNS